MSVLKILQTSKCFVSTKDQSMNKDWFIFLIAISYGNLKIDKMFVKL